MTDNSMPAKLTQRIKSEHTSYKSACNVDYPDEKTVWFDVGVQHFKVADAENNEHAEWYREMLAKALTKIIKAQLSTYKERLEGMRRDVKHIYGVGYEIPSCEAQYNAAIDDALELFTELFGECDE